GSTCRSTTFASRKSHPKCRPRLRATSPDEFERNMALGRRSDATGKIVPIHEARKGRGAVSHIAHRFETREREPDGDALDAPRAEQFDGDDDPPPLATEVTFEQAGSVLAYNESPDIGFDRSINPYRGCEHGCPYCYARPTHSYLNLSPGLDFE